jgi:hypothetical protein
VEAHVREILTPNGRKSNLYEWFEKIINDFYEEQAIEEQTSFDEIKSRFYDDFHKIFFCIVPTLLFKFLIDKGVGSTGDWGLLDPGFTFVCTNKTLIAPTLSATGCATT